VRPRSYGIAASAADRTLSFNLAGPAPRYVWVTVNKLEKLFILVDAPEENPPRPGQPRVYDVATYAGVDPTGARSTTAALQAAIDDVAGKGGGTLYFGDGRYKTGTLLVRSGVFLYLSAGALIDGSGVIGEYRQDYGGQSYQIGFVKVKNAGLIGRGTVDAAGQHLRRTFGDPTTAQGFSSSKGNVVKPVLSQDLVIRGVVLRNPPSFTSRISGCDGVVFDQVKVLAHLDQTNTDGLDPDSSRNVVIANSFGYNGDDSVSVKTSNTGVPAQRSHGIRVSGNVFWTRKTALKIGTESRADIRDVLFEDNDVVHADRGVGLYVHEGATVSGIKWINNRLEVIADDMKRALIYCELKQGSVSDILIKDLACESFSEKQSHISAGFDGLVIENMTVAGKKVTTAAEARISSASKIEFR
jgi:polygalacturonase